MLGLEGIERSQKKLYRSQLAELALLEKQKTKEIYQYEKSFKNSFPKNFRTSDKKTLLASIKAAKVVLVGDFHTFRQSQKGFLRLLENFKNKNVAIALECFQSKFQSSINDYLNANITLDELREESQFEFYWPFSWDNYKEILIFAKSNKLKVLALNIEEKKQSLEKRDLAAAKILSDFITNNKKYKIFSLYGDLHLAPNHLPTKLKSLIGKKSTLVVHQNNSDLYWKIYKKINSQKIDVVQLREQEFCIMNAVPWVKLRSYIDWLEGNPSEEDHLESEPADLILEYAKFLKSALSLPNDIRESFEVIPEQQTEGFAKAKNFKSLSQEEKNLTKQSIKYQRTNFLLKKNTLLLPNLSLNSIAESASLICWISQLKKIEARFSYDRDSLILQYSIGYLGSKIINPKRKCNEVADLIQHKKRMQFQLALFLLSPLLPEIGAVSKPKTSNKLIELEACRIAGYILGERLYLSLSRGELAVQFIRKIFFTSTSRAAWSNYQLKSISAYLKKKKLKGKKKNDQF